MSAQPAQRKPKRGRWIVRGIATLLMLAAVGVGVLAVMGKVTQSRWEKLAAEIRASGQPLTLEEVLASRPAIPPEEDGGPIIQAALDELAKLAILQEGVLMLDKDCLFEFPQRLDAKCLERTREYLKSHEGMLDELAKLLEFPDARLKVDYAVDVTGMISGALPVFSGLRQLSKVLYIDAAVASVDGDHHRAVRDMALLLRLAGAIHEEPKLIAKLVAMAVDGMGARLVLDVLQVRVLPESKLTELQDANSGQVSRRSMRTALLGERAHAQDRLHAVSSMSGKPPLLSWERLVPWYDPWFFNQNRLDLMLYYSRLIAAAEKSPTALLAEARAEETRLRKWRFPSTFVSIVAPSMANAMRLHLRSLGESRCVVAIVAAERYRLANGAFPRELSDLVPAFLDAVPADPFDDKPLRLKHEDDGALVVYSIGENEVDDGGLIDAPGSRGRAPDVGFRLLPPERRALPKIE